MTILARSRCGILGFSDTYILNKMKAPLWDKKKNVFKNGSKKKADEMMSWLDKFEALENDEDLKVVIPLTAKCP